MFCLRASYRPFILYVLLFLLPLCLAGWWLGDWLALGISLSFPLVLSSLVLSQALIPPLTYSRCPPALPILPLPSYWLFSLLLDQSGALGRQSNMSLHC